MSAGTPNSPISRRHCTTHAKSPWSACNMRPSQRRPKVSSASICMKARTTGSRTSSNSSRWARRERRSRRNRMHREFPIRNSCYPSTIEAGAMIMSILARVADLLQAKTQKLLDRLEDPNDTLDLSYEKMISGLQETKQHLAEVVTEQKVLERQIQSAQQEADQAQENARLALQSSREDLARAALSQRQAALEKVDTLGKARANIAAQADKLIGYQRTLEDRIEQFRTQKEVMKSSYAAAQAQVRVTESITGVGDHLSHVGDAMRRAEDKVSGMQAKADAMSDLMQAGVLKDPLDHRSSVERELQNLRNNSSVDAELEKL